MDLRGGNTPQITTAEFNKFAEFLHEHSGIVLTESKKYLVASRLAKIMQLKDAKNITELIRKIENDSAHRLRQLVIEAMTTNETSWFRDLYPFNFFKDEFLNGTIQGSPALGGSIEIWSAACSSGQEPYSLSISFSEAIKANPTLARKTCSILATDISTEILAQARAGVYNSIATRRGLNDQMLNKYFASLGMDMWQLNKTERERVTFEQLNLLDSNCFQERFHIVFCRNVLIYFSAENKRQIITNFYDSLKPGGFLILGASESANDLKDCFQMERIKNGVVFKKK